MFATWSILSNITAGVILFFFFPFRIGDTIKIHDKDFPIEAEIDDINAFHVFLITAEGEKITYTITTENVADETVLSYTLSGPRITEADIYQGLTGEFTIINNTATVVLDVSSNEDNGDTEIPDENEDLFFSIDDTNVTTTVVILGVGSDDPAYSVVADKLTVDEGDSVIYTINTLNVQDNTVLNYTLSGDYISGDDIVGSLLTGSFTVVNNTATVEVGIAADTLLEDAELLTFTIDDTDAFINIIINAQGEDIVDAVSSDLTDTNKEKFNKLKVECKINIMTNDSFFFNNGTFNFIFAPHVNHQFLQEYLQT
jgi:hypothetical protein